jgi:DNA-binding NarL/FixJ family response regulator
VDNALVPKVNVLLVEDDNFARATLSAALSAIGMQVTACSSASKAFENSKKALFELAILDLDLGPGPNGIDLAFKLRSARPNIGIIFLTSYSDPRLLNQSSGNLPLGSRYLLKSELSNINTLTRLIEYTLKSPLKASSATGIPKSNLNHNQIEVLRLVAAGYSTEQIAEQLTISAKSVESTITRINSKFNTSAGMRNKRVELAKIYYRLIGKLQ